MLIGAPTIDLLENVADMFLLFFLTGAADCGIRRMDSKAALHSGCGRATGLILAQARRSSASSTPGTTPTTDASPLRAKGGVMVLAAPEPPAARSRANQAGLIRAADRLAVRVPVAHSESRHQSDQSRGPRQRSASICLAASRPIPLPGRDQGLPPGQHHRAPPESLRCVPSSATDTPITSMKMVTRAKSLRPSCL